ncbi:MAG: response regulator [Magnetococcales bacterium]|nr:response regulator [Magnetococcales bacterium]
MESVESPVQVAVIDDDEDQYVLIKGDLDTIEHTHYQVTWIDNAQDGIAAILSENYDAILLDYKLGGITGMDVLREVDAVHTHPPLIMVTGYGAHELDVASIKAGALDFISKDEINPTVLERSIRHTMERAKVTRALRKSETALREFNRTLEAQVLDRTRELEKSNQEVELFAYTIAHDLRAPLGNVRGFAQILMLEHAGELSPSGRDHLKWLLEGAIQMEGRIADYLKLSRASRSALQKKSVNLSKLAETITTSLQMLEPNREVKIDIEPGLHAVGDPGFLPVVMENLLGNAWKFTAQQNLAHIQFGAAKSSSGFSGFYVRDNGVGFDANSSEGLFDPFLRLHSQDEFSGTGIGLAMVQRIIQRHNGDIWAEAKQGRGATFYFTLEGELSGEDFS